MKVAGFGFRAAATVQALQDALATAGGAVGLTALATADDKSEAPAITALSRALNLPLLAIPLADLRATQATPRDRVPARYGHQSLAEAAALAGAGPGARLIIPRSLSACGTATCAIAEGPLP